ncbi:MAG: DUF998 domain-containing protein [Caldilineaceae bacterium]
MRKALLTGGMVAGPLYLIVGLIQAFTRPGFDFTRHPLSVLSNGDLGWIQVTNFVVTGLLVIGAAVGMRQTLASGRGRTWGPILVGIYGLSLIGAAIFKADPALGFPAGTPMDQNIVTTTGILHFVCGGIGFLALIIACFVFARRFAAQGARGWRIFSVATGIVFLAAFVGIGAGAGNPWTLLGFWIGLTVAWAWLSALCAHLRRLPNA